MSRISKTVRTAVRSGTSVPATIVDIISSSRASARLSGNGAIYRNLVVIGGPAQKGDSCHVDLTTPEPTIIMVGKTWMTEDDVNRMLKKLPKSSAGSTFDIDKIWVFSSSVGATPYSRDGDGLKDALSGASPGDKVVVPAGSITYNEAYTVPEKVNVVGFGRERTIIYQKVYLNRGSSLSHISIINDAYSSYDEFAVSGPTYGGATVNNCTLTCFQDSIGTAVAAFQPSGGKMLVQYSSLRGEACLACGYASRADGTMIIEHSSLHGNAGWFPAYDPTTVYSCTELEIMDDIDLTNATQVDSVGINFHTLSSTNTLQGTAVMQYPYIYYEDRNTYTLKMCELDIVNSSLIEVSIATQEPNIYGKYSYRSIWDFAGERKVAIFSCTDTGEDVVATYVNFATEEESPGDGTQEMFRYSADTCESEDSAWEGWTLTQYRPEVFHSIVTEDNAYLVSANHCSALKEIEPEVWRYTMALQIYVYDFTSMSISDYYFEDLYSGGKEEYQSGGVVFGDTVSKIRGRVSFCVNSELDGGEGPDFGEVEFFVVYPKHSVVDVVYYELSSLEPFCYDYVPYRDLDRMYFMMQNSGDATAKLGYVTVCAPALTIVSDLDSADGGLAYSATKSYYVTGSGAVYDLETYGSNPAILTMDTEGATLSMINRLCIQIDDVGNRIWIFAHDGEEQYGRLVGYDLGGNLPPRTIQTEIEEATASPYRTILRLYQDTFIVTLYRHDLGTEYYYVR